MNRVSALEFLKQHLKNSNLIKHSLAVEAIMIKLAEHFNQDQEKWGLAGLLHDIDYEETKDKPEAHSLKGAKILEAEGIDKEITEAVKKHNEVHNLERLTLIEKSLFCVDPLTGLIVAAALVLPDKKLTSLTVENILNRFKEKSFARGANREVINACSEINLSLEEFVKLGLEAMKKISNDLRL